MRSSSPTTARTLMVAAVSALAVLCLAGPASAATSLYGVQPSTGDIVRVDPSTGAVLSSFAAPDALAPSHTSLGLSGAEEGASLIYLNANVNSGRIYRLDPDTGAVLSQESGFSSGGLSFQTGAAGQQYIFLLDGEFDIHRQTGFSGGEEYFWGPFPPGPRQAVGGDDQGREFALYADGQIREYDPFTDSDALRTFAPPAAGVQGMAYDGTNLYVSTGDGTLYTLDPDTGAVRATATVAGGALFGLGAIVSVPSAPTDLSTEPASPADENQPRVRGTAEAGSTVRVFATADCSGTPVATGSAAEFASPGLVVSVADNSTTTFRATATNGAGASACSTSSVTYREDSAPPAAPSNLGTAPGSPSNDNTPRITGMAESGSTVRIYTTADCTGTPVATGSAAAFGSPGLQVSVADNSETSFRARAVDAAGNVSACSAPVTYREDSSSPPARPAADATSPRVSLSGIPRRCTRSTVRARVRIRDASALTSVRVYVDGRRTATTRRARFTVRISTRRMKAGGHRITVVATDAAGNRTTTRRAFGTCAARPRFAG